ncbi:hypothetical protein B0J11DRAFT_575562 [Dendryphion nanum]|uniref:Uncharacterized protein n=1 Tax=Dendryphion nanum TaxID=256645 RepID=A0A9P9EC75_9PLEO|nr:hypothetical protein B0J11DRAFT_575562 [Dendryphion nanum]
MPPKEIANQLSAPYLDIPEVGRSDPIVPPSLPSAESMTDIGSMCVNPPHVQNSPLSFLRCDTWLYEFLCFCFALIVLVVLATYLNVCDGKPMWTKGIALNTIVAIASGLFRASIMVPVSVCISQSVWIWMLKEQRPLQHVIRHDQASRGPWGSVHALARARSSSPLLLLGAFITIVVLATEPFFQQSVGYYDKNILDPQLTAATSSALTYRHNPEDGMDVPWDMINAVYDAFTNPVMPSPPLYNCPLGNCNWRSFPTLGIEVQCRNIKHEYSIDCSEDIAHRYPFPGGCALVANNQTTKPLPEQLPPDMVFQLSAEYKAVSQLNLSHWNNPDRIVLGYTDIRFVKARPKLGYTTKDTLFDASQCILYTTIKEITAISENAIYTEIHTPLAPFPPLGSVRDTNISAPLKYDYYPDCARTSKARYCFVEKGCAPISKITECQEFYRKNLSISVTIKDFEDLLSIVPRTLGFSGNITSVGAKALEGPTILQLLYKEPCTNCSLTLLSPRMTTALRVRDSTIPTARIKAKNHFQSSYVPDTAMSVHKSHLITGDVFLIRPYVEFRWTWLLLPGTLLFLVGMLLWQTSMWTTRGCIGVWKDNPLATYMNASWRPTHVGVEADTSDQVESISKDLYARLRINTSGHESGRAKIWIEIKQRHMTTG